jgi:NADH-quinone oxidoreductase subunit G
VKYPLIKDSAFQAQNPLLEDILVNLAVTMPIDYETKTSSRIKITAVIDSLIDLEGLYIMSQALKLSGAADIQAGNNISKINFDIPAYYTLNRSVNSLSNLTTLLMIGVNPRFETSILNTSLRKHQLARDLTYYFIGVYANLKLKQNHLGISPKKLVDILMNKSVATKELVLIKGASIFLGAEILKSKNGAILQNLVRLLAKRLFVKTAQGDRLGVLQGNSTQLIFNQLGIAPSVRSNLYVEEIQDKKIDLLYTVQPHGLTHKK